jgi:hypothetical protein
MDQTPNLSLPYIHAAQAQKHVTHNEAIRRLDAVVQISVVDRDLASPPASPAEGARYLVAAGASGAWSGQETRIAAWQDGAWAYYAPAVGWTCWVADEAVRLTWSGSAWVNGLNPTPLIGVNATADATNRLAVAAAASLLNHAGSGHQLKINKAAAGDTAALLYQTAFAGRAEMGLAGDDDWRLKVSSDGAEWRDAVRAERATGRIYLPGTPADQNLLLNPRLAINQRAFAGGALAADAYGFDRWKAGPTGCNVTLAAGDAVTLTSGTLRQVVEAGVWEPLAGATITFSVEDLSGGTLNVAIGAQSGSIAAGSGRRKLTVTLGAGETGDITVGLTPAAGAVTFRRPKLELGAEATAWRGRPLATEVAFCERYFLRTVAEIGFQSFGPVMAKSATAGRAFVAFRTPMRAAPTLAHSGAATLALLNTGTDITLTALSATLSSWGGVLTPTVAGGLTPGEALQLKANANAAAYLQFNAEL